VHDHAAALCAGGGTRRCISRGALPGHERQGDHSRVSLTMV